MKRQFKIQALIFCATFVFAAPAHANVKEIKLYKEAFPDEKPKCIGCHMDQKPKKEGPHELNAYGKKAKALADEAKKESPDADTFKQVGKIPEA